MAIPTVELQTREPESTVVPIDPAPMFERLARDPNASVEKIERLMALWERTENRKAETLFNQSMSEAQAKMRPVAADASNPQTKSRYASYAALDKALRPIYTTNGFGLSFDTDDSPLAEHVRVVCLVTHVGGFSRPYRIDMPADGKGAKGGDVMTKTHAAGSAISYGMRYLLRMIFNVSVGEDDDDGNQAARPTNGNGRPPTPRGYEEWLDNLRAVADEGVERLRATFKDSPQVFTLYLTKHDRQTIDAIRLRAERRR